MTTPDPEPAPDRPAELRTDRLLLRPWRHEDAPRMLDLLSRVEVVQWLGDGPPVLMADLEEAHTRIDRYRERSAEEPLGFWAVERPDGVVAGTVLLSVLPGAEHGEVEIGWHLHPDSWGAGYATEAARALLGYGFAHGLPEIIAVSHTHNDASQAVMRRLGMTDHGVTHRWYEEPSAFFSMTAEEWAEQRAEEARQAKSD